MLELEREQEVQEITRIEFALWGHTTTTRSYSLVEEVVNNIFRFACNVGNKHHRNMNLIKRN